MGRRVVQTLPQMFIETVEETPSKLLVAAYARVSTEKEEQEDSFERQVEHYKQLINSKPDWQYVDIYADPGISGTRAEKRKDFIEYHSFRIIVANNLSQLDNRWRRFMYNTTPTHAPSRRAKQVPGLCRIHVGLCFFKAEARPMLFSGFDGFYCVR